MKRLPLDPLRLPLTGVQLIEASAGTGKTYTITTIVLRLLLERELGIERIVVVTFTRAATAELRDRIRRRIATAAAAFEQGVAPEGDLVLEELLRSKPAERALQLLRAALRDLDRSAIFTIHGFAQRMLQEHAFESGARFDLELVGEQRTLITEVAHDFWAAEIATLSETTWRALKACNVTFRSVVALAHVAAAAPDLPLSQDVSERGFDELERSMGALGAAWERVAELYARSGAEAFALLQRPGLNQRYFAPPRLAGYRRELEALLSGPARLFRTPPGALKWLATPNIKANKGHRAPEHPLFDAVAELAQAHEEARKSAAAAVDGLRCRLVAFARERVAAEHARAGTQSFDDSLYGLRGALRGNSRTASALAAQIRSRFPVALIDEFQDTDPVQYEIFQRVYGESRRGEATALFLIGDPKQAIYAFRGADVRAYLQAARDAEAGADEGQGIWTLTTNYRSDPGLITALNHLFGRLDQPFLDPEIGYTPVSAAPHRKDVLRRRSGPVTPFEIVYLSREAAGRSSSWEGTEEWLELAAEEVQRLLDGSFFLETERGEVPVEPRHIAILTRTNRQAQDIQEALRLRGIPSVLQGDRTVFEAPEAAELALILRALAEPTNGRAVRTALATRFLGLGAAEIAKLADDEASWEEWSFRFREWNALWAERGFMHVLERVVREQGVVERTLRALDGERRMTNLRHLAELLHQAERERHLGIPGLLQWFDEARTDPSRHGMAPEAQQLRLESDADAVVLTTMHKSKGLEYPIVVLPFLGAKSAPFSVEQDNLKFHNPDHGDRLELDVRDKEQKPHALALALQEHQAESLRLAYVALTRARHHCIALWGGVAGNFSSLGYLLHQPAGDLGGLGVDVGTRLRELDDAGRLAELEALAAASDGTIRVRPAAFGVAGPYVPAAKGPVPDLEARRLLRRIPAAVRTSSFSALARAEASHLLSRPAREGRDVDDVVTGEASQEITALRVEPQGTADAVLLADFPRGAKPGEFLHAVLEKVPFGRDERELRQPILEAELRRRGFEPTLLPVVERAIDEVLRTPLSRDSDWSLADLGSRQRISEMEFTLPVRRAGATPLTARALANAMRRESAAPWTAEYLKRLERLGFSAWSGYLRGFIDLVCERDGAYFVIDFKSNHLGPRPEDYRPERLAEVMGEHHYYLQYVLYSVALHRYLRQRIVNYSVDRHFGGVYYLFLRGMRPETGPERGVYFHRPSTELIEAVSALLAAEEIAEGSASCG